MAPGNQIVSDDVKWSRAGKTICHVTGNVTWQMVTWRKTSVDPDRSRMWHRYVGPIT